jgi:hypothetical protein
MLHVNGALTSVKLWGNMLGDEGWGAIFAAICGNKDSKIMSLDASCENISPAGVQLIAEALRTSVTGALTVTNLLRNELDAESAKMLVQVAKQKGISLCGIQRDQTTADFSSQGLMPPDAILLASDLSQAVITGALTNMSLACNMLDEEGTKAICKALKHNKTLKELDLSGFVRSNIGGAAGAKHVADMLGVNSGLTVTNLLGNQLDAESAKLLAEVAKQKGISLCGIRRDQITADFPYHKVNLPDAILLASDLSQADVTGALTRVDVCHNNITGDGAEQISAAVLGNLKIEMFNKIPIKEMRANSLTELDLNGKGVGVEGGMVVAGLIPVMGALTTVWTSAHDSLSSQY